jgi:tripartite-type tricarboxylate transporter receptor subunit TctC
MSLIHRFLAKFAALVLLLASFSPSSYAAYPEKPIHVIVPSAAGGAADQLVRALTNQMSLDLGVPFVVENKPGGSYVIGTMEVVRAAPDGYTLAYANVVSLATNSSLLKNVPYQIDKDLTLIGNALRVVNLLVVNKEVPVNNVQELIAYAKKNPGKLSFGSEGNGTTSHLGMELFKAMTQTDMVHVPYKAATNAVSDLLGGQIQVLMLNAPTTAPHVEAGRLKGLGISGKERSPSFPNIPTIAEQGVLGFEVTAWGGLVGPAKLPQAIVDRLNASMRKALQDPALIVKFAASGSEAAPSTAEEFRQMSITETAKWAEVVKKSGAKID